LGEAAPVVFLVRGAEGESDFFQDVVPTTLDDQEEEGSNPTCT
jgi:hypothetical protein